MSKTIVDKLNLRKYERVAILDQPEGPDYFTELTGYDTSLKDGGYDLIFSFALDMEAMKTLVGRVIAEQALRPNGYLFVAYPKMGNKKYATSIHRDELFPGLGADEDGYIAGSAVKFARMVGLDDTFTVVGFKEDSKSKGAPSPRTAQPSQRVDDYVELIPSVEQDLSDSPELLAFYRSLTPGYRKDWARYVYSAKQEETRENRRQEMKAILQAGYKSRELYRQAGK
ncbi:YdeI/OmpD-associated family protein [Cohnella hongkongensis]|uniref:YdeI/OmpD-associated family protein n=1 Tax=Cohnella hongkongensis TaxID=178337 RepID=A0ABV9FF41_9BACL